MDKARKLLLEEFPGETAEFGKIVRLTFLVSWSDNLFLLREAH